MKNQKLKYLFQIIFILIIFLLVSYFVQSNLNFFKDFLGKGPLGLLAYILLGQIAMIFAPLSSMPLIPVVSQIMGPFYASLLNLFSWTLGSILVFFISRKWGVKIIGKLISLKDIYKIEHKIPKENQFWGVVLLRIIFPVDLISYALGIFSDIKFKHYVLASFLGILPKAFIASYFGYIKFEYQIISLLVIGIIILFVILFKKLFQ